MRLPLRRSQQNPQHDDNGPILLTPAGIQRMHDEIRRLESQKPQAIEDVVRTQAMGDYSENAEYQEAKHRLRRMDARLFHLKDRLKRVVEIGSGGVDRVVLGSTVTVASEDGEKSFLIVGPSEANPSRGRISHVSPLGTALMGHRVGDVVSVKTDFSEKKYSILSLS